MTINKRYYKIFVIKEQFAKIYALHMNRIDIDLYYLINI